MSKRTGSGEAHGLFQGRRLAILGLGSLFLTACGKKAGLRPPDDAQETYSFPRPYPDPKSVVPESPPPEEGKTEAEQNTISPLPKSRTTTTTY